MTEPGHGRPNAAPADPAGWIRAIASGLTATGIPATTNGDHIAGLDVTAVICPPGRARAEVMIDEDGWAELRWFTDRTVPPADVAAGITRVLTAITAAPAILAPDTARP
ncbi:MAG TPA: hypothetical protein VMV07_14035 [Streptosporangiaceae bacterium]|nr:hypothetical protein [Streptosporangiaceae bacterium]